VYQTGQKRASGQHDRSGIKAQTNLRDHAANAITVERDIVGSLLEEEEIGLMFQCVADRLAVENPVRLRPRSPHCGPFPRVQDAKLDTRLVSRSRHESTEGIYFFD
jgi:hypothetical protein